jgi:hypothetical protein
LGIGLLTGLVWWNWDPSAAYEAEFEVCKCSLHEHVPLRAGALEAVRGGRWNDVLEELSERSIVLDLPSRYSYR